MTSLSASEVSTLVDAAWGSMRRREGEPVTLLTEGEPMTVLTVLSAKLYFGGWSALSDRVADVRGAYRDMVVGHRPVAYCVAATCDALQRLVADLEPQHCQVCGERDGSPYAKRCCTDEQMVEG